MTLESIQLIKNLLERLVVDFDTKYMSSVWIFSIQYYEELDHGG